MISNDMKVVPIDGTSSYGEPFSESNPFPVKVVSQAGSPVSASPSASAITSVASATTSATIKAANTSRKGLTVFNDSTAILYIALAATASTTAYTAQVGASDYYEVPFGYAGPVSGVWATANGNARVTEIT